MSNTAIVVPCYNEALRIDLEAFRGYSHTHDEVRFIMVNDGSLDSTEQLLTELEARQPDRFELLNLDQNVGKAEAVRQGMLHALKQRPSFIGFWDADLATPLGQIDAFIRLLGERHELEMVLGSRVQLLGRIVERRPWRHYLGRVFATFVSLTLRLPVYDTQCGAKLFRTNSDLESLLDEPFLARWIFDVELLARFLAARPGERHAATVSIYEYPLDQWRDVPGSKLQVADFLRAVVDLGRIARRY